MRDIWLALVVAIIIAGAVLLAAAVVLDEGDPIQEIDSRADTALREGDAATALHLRRQADEMRKERNRK